MPRPVFPPTPAPSTDIKGREYAYAPQHGPEFELPPSAIASRSNSASSRDHVDPPKPSVSPISPRAAPHDDAGSRKRSHAQSMSLAQQPSQAPQPADSGLPPPPSRSRKIIQVKPKEQQQQPKRTNPDDEDYDPNAKTSPATGGGKKKNASTSAGRKIARKTAHSLIERRRRSKMNEEFGVLKDLIPACRGHEMHKLAILQASIDYLRYLENCVADLKAEGHPQHHPAQRPVHPESGRGVGAAASNENALQSTSSDEEEEDEDEPMADRDEPQQPPLKQHKPSVSQISIPSISQTPTPVIPPNFGPYRETRHYSQASSEAPSPFFGAQHHGRDWYRPTSQSSYPASPSLHSQQTSPMLLPQGQGQSSELDREASAALLMLNASDRRSSVSKPAGARMSAAGTARDRPSLKGISVKDLLSN